MARRSVWPDAEVRQLVSRFVPAGDDVLILAREPLFETFWRSLSRDSAEDAVRTLRHVERWTTKQGVYAMTPDGEHLGSLWGHDSTKREEVVAMLGRALKRWGKELKPREDEERGAWAGRTAPQHLEGGEVLTFASDALLLKVTYRNLPRKDGQKYVDRDWLGWPTEAAWNHDWTEFTRADAASFVPADGEKQRDVPDAVIRRLARTRLRDHVQGHGRMYQDRDVRSARLTATAARVEGDVVTLQFEGAAVLDDGNLKIDACLQGGAAYDRKARRFVSFELVAVGMRSGPRGGNYRDRHGERRPGPLGVAFTLGD